MISRENRKKNLYMLRGLGKRNAYDWWWHSFTGYHSVTGEMRSFFIEFYVVNPGISPKKVSFGQDEDPKKKESKPSYVMIKVGTWGKGAKQIHNFFPAQDLEISRRKLDITIGNNHLTETELSGSVSMSTVDVIEHPEYMCESGSMSWNLKMKKEIPFNIGIGTSGLVRSLWAAQMYWHVQGVKTQYSGTVNFDGEEYNIIPQKSFGYADKNWGKDYTNPWVWLSSSNLISLISGQRLQNSCFDIGGGTPKVFGRSYPRTLLVFFYHEGEKHEFNFTKFRNKSHVDFSFTENNEMAHWSVTAQDNHYLIDAEIFCKKSEMFLINYMSPNGQKLHNQLWNGGTGFGEIRLYKKVKKNLEIIEQARVENCGCEYGEY